MLGKFFRAAVTSLLIVTLSLLALWVVGSIAPLERHVSYVLDGRLLSVGMAIFIALMGISLYKDRTTADAPEA